MNHERLNEQQFDRFRDFIYRTSGIRIEKGKVTMLSNRIRSRVNAGGFTDFDHYYRFLTSSKGAGELSGFLDAITTNETYFFRTQKHFDWLKSDWIEEQVALMQAGNREPRLRVLSAGCSSGAEPYSIAMCLAENMYRLRDWTLEILGTDISDAELNVANRGAYSDKALQAVSDRQKKRFFQYQSETDLWVAKPLIRQLVTFDNHNLMDAIRQEPFDCIFIRNVLIYFDAESKQIALGHLLDSLAVGGYIILGPSEGVYGMLRQLKRITPLIYQKVEITRPADHAKSTGDVAT